MSKHGVVMVVAGILCGAWLPTPARGAVPWTSTDYEIASTATTGRCAGLAGGPPGCALTQTATDPQSDMAATLPLPGPSDTDELTAQSIADEFGPTTHSGGGVARIFGDPTGTLSFRGSGGSFSEHTGTADDIEWGADGLTTWSFVGQFPSPGGGITVDWTAMWDVTAANGGITGATQSAFSNMTIHLTITNLSGGTIFDDDLVADATSRLFQTGNANKVGQTAGDLLHLAIPAGADVQVALTATALARTRAGRRSFETLLANAFANANLNELDVTFDLGPAPTTTTTSTSSTTSTSTSTTSSTSSSTSSSSTTSTSSSSTTSTSSSSTSSTSSTSSSTSSSSTSSSSTSSSSSSTSTSSTTSSTSTTLPAPGCGNGVREGAEECDDGNLVALDGCDALCLNEDEAFTPSGTAIDTPGGTADDPVGVSLTTPAAGTLLIVETTTTMADPTGFMLLGRQVHLEAPDATAAMPHVIAFRLDATILPPGGAAAVEVFRDGMVIADCTATTGEAVPDPCVRERAPADGGDALLTVFTSHASEWNFGLAGAPTTTVTTTSTTTSTMPELVAGKKLLLKDKAGKPQKRALKMIAKDAGITLGEGNGSGDDPTVAGGSLRIYSAPGGFDTTIALPAERWKLIGKAGQNKGYKLKKAPPVKAVVVKAGKLIKVVGKGEALGLSLATNPDPVLVELGLGTQRYCAAFPGGTFKDGRKYVAKTTQPAGCPPAGSPSGAFVR